jgi:ABC-2 type transport system ATP-binding protein
VLSTHILSEVEAVCDRVVILDRGRIIGDGKPSALGNLECDVRIVARGDRATLAAALAAVDGVVEVGGDDEVYLVRTKTDRRSALARAVLESAELLALGPAASGLSRVFAELRDKP